MEEISHSIVNSLTPKFHGFQYWNLSGVEEKGLLQTLKKCLYGLELLSFLSLDLLLSLFEIGY